MLRVRCCSVFGGESNDFSKERNLPRSFSPIQMRAGVEVAKEKC